MYYRKGLVREEFMAIVIISYATCLSLGASMDFRSRHLREGIGQGISWRREK